MEKVSPQVRILAIVLLLVGLAGMLMLRTMGPSADGGVVQASVVTPTPKPAAAKPQPKPAAKPATAKATPTPEPEPAVNAPKPEVPATGFPKAVDRALEQNPVVVLSLVVPGARVDALAAAEAEAGAKLGGAGYLSLNVLQEGVARALLTKLENIQDPSVLVVKRSGEVALQLNGFVDRETVAQAAANASP